MFRWEQEVGKEGDRWGRRHAGERGGRREQDKEGGGGMGERSDMGILTIHIYISFALVRATHHPPPPTDGRGGMA